MLKLFKSTITCPFTNLAIEEYLFNTIYEPNCDIFHVYRNSRSVILGRNQNPFKELNFELIIKDSVPVVRRQSGGGTVYHDLGNTNYLHIMPRSRFDRKFSVGMVNRALHELDIPSFVNNRHDIYVGDKKVSGSAFKLVKDKAYHHGTMLIDTELDKLTKYLHPKSKNLKGGGIESVRSMVTRLRDHSFTADSPSFIESCFNIYAEHFEQSSSLSLFEQVESRILFNKVDITNDLKPIIARMKSKEWIYGQTPKFTLELGNGVIVLVEKGIITDISGPIRDLNLIGDYIHELSSVESELAKEIRLAL